MVEIVLVLVEDHSSVSLVDDEHAVEEFAADAGDEPFGDGVGPRARTGVLITRIPTAAKIASKVVVNLASRSRMRNGSADRRRGGSSRNCGPGEPARRRSVVGYPRSWT
jgi:hypothetical protein